MQDIEQRLRRLLDKDDISEQLHRWSRGVARRDWALVRNIFHPDAYDDHGVKNGTLDEYIDWQRRHHSGVDQSVHFIGNIVIEFADDDHALSESHVIAFHHYLADRPDARADIVGEAAASEMGEMTSLMVGRYIDKFIRTADGWRILHRQAVFETARVEEAGCNLLPHWTAARRDLQDPLHAARAELGLGSLSD
jgi:hypothetical protein